jgi:ribulose kinase
LLWDAIFFVCCHLRLTTHPLSKILKLMAFIKYKPTKVKRIWRWSLFKSCAIYYNNIKQSFWQKRKFKFKDPTDRKRRQANAKEDIQNRRTRVSLLSLSSKQKKKIELSEGGHVGSAWQDNNKPKQLIGKVIAPATGRQKTGDMACNDGSASLHIRWMSYSM